ncbi:hypothetical protein JSO61_004260 [Riemerella anatipestifer]|uniref:hypothetical protein n=1 Tax=Riemerella anatipestifer TaxID=34085 RepID=UPI0030C64991
MVKLITEEKINQIKKNPEKFGINLELFEKELSYSSERKRISEVFYGAYIGNKLLKVDDNYFINVCTIEKAVCELEKVSLIDKTKSVSIKNIRTFYVKNYYLHTSEEFNGKLKHQITEFLNKIGQLNKRILENGRLYSINNSYQAFQHYKNKKAPKDLYHPIKKGINDTFFRDDYKIDDFEVITNIQIE